MRNPIALNIIYGTPKSAQRVTKATILKTDAKMIRISDRELQHQTGIVITDITTKKTDKYV
jgi:hypothetical protein